MTAVIYIILYVSSYILAASGHQTASGAALIIAGVILYYSEFRKTGNPISLRGLFSLSFTGGQGISCLQLSYIQSSWTFVTWGCFFIAQMGVWLSWELVDIFMNKKQEYITAGTSRDNRGSKHVPDMNRLYICILALTAVSLTAFITEACILKFIPLFERNVPHAYSYFHISGLHYFTVSCVLVPAMSVIWFIKNTEKNRKKEIRVLIASAVTLFIPVMCVSRFQFVFAVALAVCTAICLKKRVRIAAVIAVIASGIAVLAILSVARSHDSKYLNSIFEMKPKLPVFISRVYIYIANNYDNFDCMVRQLPEHTWGLKLLFPVFALTGLKFVMPELAAFPLYVTKPELTTLTLFYDAYYDFGVTGVFFFAVFVGILIYCIEYMTRHRGDAMSGLFYGQFSIYMGLAFFTTWFSNPTTWFYLFVTLLIYLYCTGRIYKNAFKKYIKI